MPKPSKTDPLESLRPEFVPLNKLALCDAVSEVGRALYPADWCNDDVLERTTAAAERCKAAWKMLRRWLHSEKVKSTILDVHGYQYPYHLSIWAQVGRESVFDSVRITARDRARVGSRLRDGFVLVHKPDLQMMLSIQTEQHKSQTVSTIDAKTNCEAWFDELIEQWRNGDIRIPIQADLQTEAQRKFPGLSGRSFMAVWGKKAPNEWKKPGPKSRR